MAFESILRSVAIAGLLLAPLASTASATFTSSLKNDVLTLTQTANSGPVIIDNNGGGGEFRVLEGGTTTFSTANNLVVTLLDNTNTSLTVDLGAGTSPSTTTTVRRSPSRPR